MLKCVAVDDDPFVLSMLTDLCKESPHVELVADFNSPKVFLQKLPKLDFDICILDICMPEYDGFYLAEKLHGKHVIFITGDEGKLKTATSFAPLDIIFKPIHPERFYKAIEKACHLQASKDKKEYDLFVVAEYTGKVKVNFSDILFIESDETDPRNKVLTLKTGQVLTAMGYSFKQLTDKTDKIVQVNRSQAIAVDRIHLVKHDLVKLDLPKGFMEVTLNRKYRKTFHSLVGRK